MATTLVICYLAIALIIFTIGKVTSDPKIYNIYWASVASLFWPIAITCVFILHKTRAGKASSSHDTAGRVHKVARGPR